MRALVLFLFFFSLAAARLTAAEPDAPAPLPEFTFDQYLIAPVRVHFLKSELTPELNTTLQEADLARVFGKVNGVWKQAGVGFLLESIVTEKPEPDEAPTDALPGSGGWLPRHVLPANYAPAIFNVYYLKQFSVNGIYYPKAVFVKDQAGLRKVMGGIDEPIPRVTSHELGHALGLIHRQDIFNLMASGTTGTTLNAAEIETARDRAVKLGRFRTGPEWLLRVEALHRAGQHDEARVLEAKLAAISPDWPQLRAAKPATVAP